MNALPMTQRLMCALLLIIATDAAAIDLCGMGQSEMTARREDGSRVALILDGSRIVRTPAWDLEKSDPPLSVRAASKVAMEWANVRYKQHDRVDINTITMKSFACGDKFEHWFYVFDFSTVNNGQRSHDVGNWLAVLMDGSVVEPTTNRSETRQSHQANPGYARK